MTGLAIEIAVFGFVLEIRLIRGRADVGCYMDRLCGLGPLTIWRVYQ